MVGSDNVFVLNKPWFVGCCWIYAMRSDSNIVIASWSL